MKINNHSNLPTWYIRRQIDFVYFCSNSLGAKLPENPTFYFWKGTWKGDCLFSTNTINVYFDRNELHIQERDPRYKIQRVNIDMKNRTESFLFLLAHEMRHLFELNREMLYSLNGVKKKRRVWLMEADANGFGQSCINIYRRILPTEHLRDFLKYARIWQEEVKVLREKERIERERKDREYKEWQEREKERLRLLEEERQREYEKTLPKHETDKKVTEITLDNVFQLFKEFNDDTNSCI